MNRFPYQMVVVSWPLPGVCKFIPYQTLHETEKATRLFVDEHIETVNSVFIVNSDIEKNQLLIVDWPYSGTYKIKTFDSLEKVKMAADIFVTEHEAIGDKVFIIRGGIVQIGRP